MFFVGIIEDEEQSLEALKRGLSRYESETGVAFKVTHFRDAELFLTNYKPVYDIVFMDIKLPGMDGLEAARRLRRYDEDVCLLFTTTMAQFAIKGYEVNALDYFVKPYTYYDLKMRLDRVVRMLSAGEQYIGIPFPGGVKKKRVSEVYYIESNGHRLIYHTTEGNVEARGEPIKNLEARLGPAGFARCSSSYLVNLHHCHEVEGDVCVVGADRLHMSRGKKQEFLARFSRFLQGGTSS